MKDNAIREFSVTVYGNLTKYSDTISKARCRIFYKGANRNGTYITDEFADSLLSTITYAPIKGIFEKEEDDFSDHGQKRDVGRIYGIVPENYNLQWEKHLDEDGIEREYACVDVLLYTSLYEEALTIPNKSQSMEIYAPSIQGDWEFIEGKKLFKYTAGCFLGLQVLGDKVEPCFEGAAFYNLSEETLQFIEYLKEFGYFLSKDRKGGQSRMKVNFKLSDAHKHDILFSLLNPNYNEENDWAITYVICDVYDEYAVCYNYEQQQYERVYYSKDDENDSLTIGEKVRCFIIDVTENEKTALEAIKELNGGNYELINENYMKVADYEQKVEELNASISTLEQEKGELSQKLDEANESIQSLETENTTLNSYKKEKETAEKMAIINSYSEILSAEVLDSFKEKIDEYSAIDLDKELLYTIKQTNFSFFKQGNQEDEIIPKDIPLTGIEAILSKFKQ